MDEHYVGIPEPVENATVGGHFLVAYGERTRVMKRICAGGYAFSLKKSDIPSNQNEGFVRLYNHATMAIAGMGQWL